MQLTLQFIETRLRDMGSRCEPVTSVKDRDGMKPRGDFLLRAGLRLQGFHPDGDAEFLMVERVHEGQDQIRSFFYTRDELEAMAAHLDTAMAQGREGYALEWNFYQISRAILLQDKDAGTRQVSLMRDRVAQVPLRLEMHIE